MPASAAQLIRLLDEVTEDLNQRSFCMAFTATREYTPRAELENTDNLVVTVVGTAIRKQTDNRTDWAYEYDIDIGVQLRAKPKDGDAKAKFDSCMKLLEDIASEYDSSRPTLADMPLTAVQVGGTSGLPYVAEHIYTLNQFTGLVRLTFTQWR